MISRLLTKIKILLKQNLKAFLIVFLWFVLNFIYFYIETGSALQSGLIIFFFTTYNSLYGNFYDAFTEFIIFGLVFGLITVELFRKYNPVLTSREISKKYSDHVIIIGYTHIGQRISNYLKTEGIGTVIIEEDLSLIEDLIANEEAVINDTPLSIQTLEDAGTQKAKAVFITSDDFEIQLVVNHYIRRLNPKCRIVARIYQDDIADLIANTYNTEIISTSKYAAEVIDNKIRNHYNKVLLIGLNHISLRLMEKWKQKSHIEYQLIEESEDLIKEKIEDKSHVICGDPKDGVILEQCNISEVDCVVNTISDVKESILITKRIRDYNRSCKIISRFFLESIADILEKPPFRAEVISSSKGTLEVMIQRGMFDF
ncbi:MAG: hypothetical protein EU532_02300 [Promethearchaeota archaeon]|nr:MAG: hypothetical protein EU532_02300 [Candidatus Lokiarchaeota archaeon]